MIYLRQVCYPLDELLRELRSLLDGPTRLLILTDPEFYEIYTKKIQGFLVPGIEIVLMELPRNMKDKISKIKRVASKEVGG